ncbi:MAG: VCBS repeat-containing protein, partial [Calditrichota bacterium]
MKLVFRLLSLVMIYFLIFIVGCTQNQPDTGESLDYNGDGWQDILLIGGGTWPQYTHQTVQILWLYRNNQDGTFTQVTREAGLADLDTYAFGVTVGDYDNDGDDDFFLTTLYKNLLFRNENGVFREVAGTAGLADRSEYTSAALFFDADRDGWLDLYVGNYADWTPAKDIFCSVDGHTKSYCRPDLYESIPGRFYHNNHNGTFSDWTKQAGFLYPPEETPGNALSLVQFDYNRDGWPDLAISNDSRRNLLYQNNGDGTFTERGIISGIAFDENGRPRS